MPNYQVVRCANDRCGKFQSQQEKQSGRWSCVVCGLKQSLKRVYFESAVPKDCRAAVMDLNMDRGVTQEARIHKAATLVSSHHNMQLASNSGDDGSKTGDISSTGSKWAAFVENDPEEHLESSDDMQAVDSVNQAKATRLQQGGSVSKKRGAAKGTSQRANKASRAGNSTASIATETSVRAAPYTKRGTPSLEPKQNVLPALSQALANISQRKGSKQSARASVRSMAGSSIDIAEQGPSKWSRFAGDSEHESDTED